MSNRIAFQNFYLNNLLLSNILRELILKTGNANGFIFEANNIGQTMQQYTIHPLVVGINETDQGVMTYLRDYGKRIYLPIYVFYIKGGNKHILVDTGLEQFMVPDGAEKECRYTFAIA
jgi:hypothetical protein